MNRKGSEQLGIDLPDFSQEKGEDSRHILSVLKSVLREGDYFRILENTEKCGGFLSSLTIENYTSQELQFLTTIATIR